MIKKRRSPLYQILLSPTVWAAAVTGLCSIIVAVMQHL
jgi:hypothetical protein